MFLDHLQKNNPKLLETSFQLHQKGVILPDTYIVDMDMLRRNAICMLKEAQKHKIDLYFMLKQLGRNPYIAKELMKLGYAGAVVVDFREAQIMMDHHIPIKHVGHLVQMPKNMIEKLLLYNCTYMSVFSLEKAKEISDLACKLGKKQKVILKVVGSQDIIYSGQTAGFSLDELEEVIVSMKKYEGIKIAGVTSFPCFLYDVRKKRMMPTANVTTLQKAKECLLTHGIVIENMNAPSATCTFTLKGMSDFLINSAEPGHGLTGTTPLHAHQTCEELPCVTYISEVSHNFNHKAYCYGGGYYRRSHVANAFVGTYDDYQRVKVTPPEADSIDYYFELNEPCTISDTVVMSFRFQMFVTRSQIAIVEGIQRSQPKLVGIYTAQGGIIE